MAFVRNRLSKSESQPSARSGGVLLALIMVTVYLLFGSNPGFSVPNDVALRIRLFGQRHAQMRFPHSRWPQENHVAGFVNEPQ